MHENSVRMQKAIHDVLLGMHAMTDEEFARAIGGTEEMGFGDALDGLDEFGAYLQENGIDRQ